MRPFLMTCGLAFALALAPIVRAADFPAIPANTPWKIAVARLAKAGIVPARIIEHTLHCGGEDPACTDSNLYCAADIAYCEDLFVRVRDGRLFIVARNPEFLFRTSAEERRRTGETFKISDAYIGRDTWRYSLKHLQDFELLVAMPDGTRRAFGGLADPSSPSAKAAVEPQREEQDRPPADPRPPAANSPPR